MWADAVPGAGRGNIFFLSSKLMTLKAAAAAAACIRLVNIEELGSEVVYTGETTLGLSYSIKIERAGQARVIKSHGCIAGGKYCSGNQEPPVPAPQLQGSAADWLPRLPRAPRVCLFRGSTSSPARLGT